MRPKKFNNKGKQNIVATTKQVLRSNPGNETKIIAMGMKGISFNTSASYHKKYVESQNVKERSEIFYIRFITVLENLASKDKY